MDNTSSSIPARGQYKLNFGWERSSNSNTRKASVYLTLPVHCDAKKNTSDIFTEVPQFSSVAVADMGTSDGIEEITVAPGTLFYSFLTANSTNGKIELVITSQCSDDASSTNKTFYFKDGTKETTTSFEMCGQYKAYQPNGTYSDVNTATICFKPKSVGTKTATVTVKKDGTAIGTFTLKGVCYKQPQTITWSPDETDLVLASSGYHMPTASGSCNGTVTYSIPTADASKFDVRQSGTTWVITATGNAGDYAYISATAAATTDCEASSTRVYKFQISSNKLQYILWTQDLSLTMPKSGESWSSVSLTLNAIACDKGTTANNGHTVTYVCKDADNIVIQPKSGTTNEYEFSAKGTYTITASVPKTATSMTDANGYLGASLTRTVFVRREGEACGRNALVAVGSAPTPDENGITIDDGNNHQYTIKGLPDKMTGTYHLDGFAESGARILDQNNNSLWDDDDGEQMTISNNSLNGVNKITVQRTANPLFSSGDFSEYAYITDFKLTQKTYFTFNSSSPTMATAKQMELSDAKIGEESTGTITFKYANIPAVGVTNSNTADFTITGPVATSSIDCDCYGTATYTIKFSPKDLGTNNGAKNTAIVFTTNPTGTNQTYTLNVSATALKRDQTITWLPSQPSSTTYDKDAEIDLYASTDKKALSGEKTLESISLTEGTSLPISYKLIGSGGAEQTKIDGIAEITTTGKLKILGAGTVTIRAKQLGTNYTNAAQSSDLTFTINKANPNVSTTSATSMTLNYPNDLNNGKTITLSSDNTDKVEWEITSDDIDLVNITQNGNSFAIKPSGKAAKQITVRFTCKETNNFNSGYVDFAIDVQMTTFTLTLSESALTALPLTSTTQVDLSTLGFASTNYPADCVTYSYSIETITGGADAAIGSDNKTLSLSSEGLLQLKVTATHSTSNQNATQSTSQLSVSRGTLEFNAAGSKKRWLDSNNWSRSDIVQSHTSGNNVDLSDYNVSINADCFIGTGFNETEDGTEENWEKHRVNAKCYDLTISQTNSSARLVIGEASTLQVVGTLSNATASKLVLTANNWGQASVVFGNGSPKASVETFLPAGNGSRTTPVWHYRGIAVDDFVPVTDVTYTDDDENETTIHPWNSVQIFKWDESQNSNLDHGCWVGEMSGSSVTTNSLQPWTGYAFANMSKEDIWLTYRGTLINTMQSISLGYHYYTYTENNEAKPFANVGVNLITNSYAVPLIIEKLGFPQQGCTKQIVLYNAGSYSEWKTGGDVGDQRGTKRGQFSTVPATTGKTTGILTIPSGQSFFVTATEGSKQFTMSYGADYYSIAPSDRMYMPRIEEPEYNVLIVDVTAKGDSIADRLFLLECDSCSRQFENGYDGMKRFGDTGLPQLYAYNKFGITAVNADSTFNKQYIGFTAGSDDETYTISFETDRLFGYHSLYLTDRKLNQTVDILAGETYQFQGYTVGENTRFQINGITEEEWESQSEGENDDDTNTCDLRVVNNTLYIQGFSTNDYPAANIELFDMTGNLVWSTPLTDSHIYDLPSLAPGIYVIRLGDCHIKLNAR